MSGSRDGYLLNRARDSYFLSRTRNSDILSWAWDTELDSSIRVHYLSGSLCKARNRDCGTWDGLYDRDVIGDGNRL